jgi:serine/threonine protein kinase
MFTKGQQVGDYIIIDNTQHNQGSGTLIYKVHHKNDPNRTFILKIINPIAADISSDDAIQQLHRDYDVVTQLHHPNIITAETGVLTDTNTGALYIVLEYFDGKPISSITQQRNSRDIVSAFAQCADALVYAHSKNIYHGDIAPQNILVRRTVNNKIEVKIIDFGLARIEPYSGRPAKFSTIVGVGTLAYAAPERLQGAPPTVLSDIYSLGMVLYATLAQGLPFESQSGKGLTIGDVNKWNDSKKLAPPPISVLSAPSEVEQGLSFVALRAISRRPQLRYLSMASMRDALLKAGRGEISTPTVWIQQYQGIVVNIISAPLTIAVANSITRADLNNENGIRFLLIIGIAFTLSLAVYGIYRFIVTTSRTGLNVTIYSLIFTLFLAIGGPLLVTSSAREIAEVQPTRPTDVTITPNPIPILPQPEMPESSRTPTVTITPIPPTPTNTQVPPTPSNTRTPRPTNTPAPTRTPRPTPTPMPGLGAVQGTEELAVVINELDWYSEQDQYTPALWFRLTLTNNTDMPMEVNFDPTTVRGADSQGASLAEIYNEAIQQQNESSGWCNPLGPGINSPYEVTFTIPPRQSINRDINLTLDRNGYSHRRSGGCDLQYKFGFDVVYVDVNVPVIRYRTTTPTAIEVTNLKWKLDKPLPQ